MQRKIDGTYTDIDAWEICIPNACYTRNNQYKGNTNARIARYSTETTYNKSDEDGLRTSFNLVTIDLDNKIIYADNYGAGIDREIDYSGEIQLPLFDMSARTYQTTNSSSSFLANTDPRELDCSKFYAIDYQGRRGTYADSKIKNLNILADVNGFVYQATSTSGYGLEFPIAVGGGKTYEFRCSFETNSTDIWLVKYNTDTTFNSITKIRVATGDLTEASLTFETESNYLYSLACTRAVKDADISVVNISLPEVN
jgi:hypothetical protein